jgi:lipoyl synthase
MLRVRWLGRTRYRDALAVQEALFARSADDHLLLQEHHDVFTLGVRADRRRVDEHVHRGGDVTYHGPGQLVGYPILTLPTRAGVADTPAYVHALEQVLIDALADLGLAGAHRLDEYPGVWIGDRKIAAIGVRNVRGRTMHGFALNVDPDLAYFGHIVPCGITDKAVTSLAAEGVGVAMAGVVDAVVARFLAWWQPEAWERADVAWRHAADGSDLAAFSRGAGAGAPVRLSTRLVRAGVTEGLSIESRKPEWAVARVRHDNGVLGLRRTLRDLDLVTVCEEAGCPNLSECWSEGTATFMVGGERCTRACGFCLVDTRHPEPLDPAEPDRVAEAVARLGLGHAVVTAVARDDLPDGGAAHLAAVTTAIRDRCPTTTVELLIPDCKGDPDALVTVFAARPDVLNHNLETVARLQRAVRPSASYARSLAVLARAKDAGLTTKSGIIAGMGETDDEVVAALGDLAAVGVDIVTIGQYLRPTTNHLPVHRWVEPATFEAWRAAGVELGIAHVEASPLTRSSHHAAAALGSVRSELCSPTA